MPPFKIVAAALRKTTEHLARELVQPLDLPPDWSELEWAIARSTAAMQGISTLLANTLQWRGPPLWQSFLTEQREQSVLRHERVGSLLEQIDIATREAQISCVALKGAALRPLELYKAGERPMGDVDLLVRDEDFASIETALRRLDYVRAYAARRHTVYEPRPKLAPRGFGEHVENPLNIEVHTAVAEPLPVRTVDITNCLQPTLARPGLSAYPTLAALMLHLLLHAAGNMRAHALRQIQLHDIALLASRLGNADWRALLAGANDKRWWVFPPLALAERYYADSIPAQVLHEARAECPRTLRFATDRQALTDVSWSNLHIHALPGIAWSRTPLEALHFIRSRALPSRTALTELEQTRQSQPHLDQVRWYGISHSKRVARWLFSRPPRVQTIVSVRAALESVSSSSD
jgi:hypothetical protein